MKFQMFRTTFPKHQAGSVKSFLHPSLLPLLHMLITHCKQYFTSLFKKLASFLNIYQLGSDYSLYTFRLCFR